MKLYQLHKAYKIVERVVDAWTRDKEQTAAQVRLIVEALAKYDLLTNARIDGEFVVDTKDPVEK